MRVRLIKFQLISLKSKIQNPWLLLWLLILGFALFFSLLAVQQHRAFLTHGLDLGNVDQALWNTAQGRFLHFTLMAPVQSRLALHVEPLLLLFVPFYWLNLGGPKLLLITQAMVVALGAWPLYQLTLNNYQSVKAPTGTDEHRRMKAESGELLHPSSFILHPSFAWLALLIPLAYLLLPTLESAVLFDFHAVTLAPTFLLFAFLALEQRQNWRFAFFAVLVMACKEDMPLVVAMLGIYAGLAQRRWALASLTLGLSALWFGLAVFVVQPYFAPGGNVQLERYIWLGATPLEMIQTIISQPRLVFEHVWLDANLPGYLSLLLFPVAFLALFSPLTLLPILPVLALNLLSGNPFTWRLEDFHYGAPLAPFLFISAIYGIRHIATWIGRRASPRTPEQAPFSPLPLLVALTLLLFTFSSLYHYYRGFTPLARPFLWPEVTAHHRQLEAALAKIPADTPLFAQPNLAPHLSQRQVIYNDFGYFTDPAFPGEPVQDIVLDVSSLENIRGLQEYLQYSLLEGDTYELVTTQAGFLHFRTMNPNQRSVIEPLVSLEALPTPPALSPSFYTFTRPDGPLDYPLQMDFGDTMRLHGYSLQFNRQEEVQVTLDLEALQPLEAIQPVLYLLDAQGQPVGATADLQPALVWFPFAQWSPGQIIRVHFNTLPWYTRETSNYRLALGVIKGRDPWDMGSRQPPLLSQPTPLVVRRPAEGTLVELAQFQQIWAMPEGGPSFRRFTSPPIPHPLQAPFAGQISLLGYSPPSLSKEGTLSLTLYWQAITPLDPLTRFVQLIGPDGQVYGQQDSAPDFGMYPTLLWQPGEVVAEQVTFNVPAERPTGNYRLHIGLYQPASGERLLLPSGEDHVEILLLD